MYFKGELVNLRAITETDIKPCVEYLNNPDIILNLDDDAPMPVSYEHEKEWFTENIKNKDIYKGFHLAIETKDGRFLGSCGANDIDAKNRIATVGLFIGDKDYLGKGYGTEAMKLLLSFTFNELNINKVKLHVFEFNKRAIKSYEKCGFKVEAVAREAIFRFGKYHDEYIMSILKDEFLANEGSI